MQGGSFMGQFKVSREDSNPLFITVAQGVVAIECVKRKHHHRHGSANRC